MVKLFTNEKEIKRAIKAAVDQFRKFLKYKKTKGKGNDKPNRQHTGLD